jgi:hypothetical protein
MDLLSDSVGVIVQFLPVLLVLWLANLAERNRTRGEEHFAPLAAAYVVLLTLYAGAALVGLAALAVALQPARQAQIEEVIGTAVASWSWLGLGCLAPALIGALLLLRPVRRLVARLLPLDPDNPVHTVALSMTMLVFLNLGLSVGIGLGNLSVQVAEVTEETGRPPISLPALWTQAAMLVFIAFVGVGWGTRRSLRATLARLGLVRPTRHQVLVGIGCALALVPAVMVVEAVAQALGFGVSQDVESLTEQLVGPLFESPLGILSIGLAAAIGEESLFRGAAQPRLGLLLTAALFALLHSNYGISLSTGIVFGLGLVLGGLRIRYNTTTTMITHALYNSTLAALAFLAARFLAGQT